MTTIEDKTMMAEDKIVNIITRTSNRAIYFRDCYNSISNQTYKHINHIVTYDTPFTFEYVQKYENVLLCPVIRQDRRSEAHFPYELYCNEAVKLVKSGWIMYLDDDDMFNGTTALESIMKVVENTPNKENSLFLWRMRCSPTKFIPSDVHGKVNHSIYMGNVVSCGFMYFHKHKDKAVWDENYGSDFRVIDHLSSTLTPVWIDEVFVRMNNETGRSGNGKQLDKGEKVRIEKLPKNTPIAIKTDNILLSDTETPPDTVPTETPEPEETNKPETPEPEETNKPETPEQTPEQISIQTQENSKEPLIISSISNTTNSTIQAEPLHFPEQEQEKEQQEPVHAQDANAQNVNEIADNHLNETKTDVEKTVYIVGENTMKNIVQLISNSIQYKLDSDKIVKVIEEIRDYNPDTLNKAMAQLLTFKDLIVKYKDIINIIFSMPQTDVPLPLRQHMNEINKRKILTSLRQSGNLGNDTPTPIPAPIPAPIPKRNPTPPLHTVPIETATYEVQAQIPTLQVETQQKDLQTPTETQQTSQQNPSTGNTENTQTWVMDYVNSIKEKQDPLTYNKDSDILNHVFSHTYILDTHQSNRNIQPVLHLDKDKTTGIGFYDKNAVALYNTFISIIEDANKKNYNSIFILRDDVQILTTYATDLQQHISNIKDWKLLVLGGQSNILTTFSATDAVLDHDYYIGLYPDLEKFKNSKTKIEKHWNSCGIHEGRICQRQLLVGKSLNYGLHAIAIHSSAYKEILARKLQQKDINRLILSVFGKLCYSTRPFLFVHGQEPKKRDMNPIQSIQQQQPPNDISMGLYY